jgi:hypothetical protein
MRAGKVGDLNSLPTVCHNHSKLLGSRNQMIIIAFLSLVVHRNWSHGCAGHPQENK